MMFENQGNQDVGPGGTITQNHISGTDLYTVGGMVKEGYKVVVVKKKDGGAVKESWVQHKIAWSSTITRAEKRATYVEWTERDRDNSTTLEEWLENRFGVTPDGTLKVPQSTFYGWRRYVENS